MQKKRKGPAFPGLKIEGPIQYDAAVDSSVAKTKLLESDVAGKANTFVAHGRNSSPQSLRNFPH
ncbi:MAG: hypothetical protein K8R75_09275 [Deltaproteobacteria bacterium]|nr:hypothetical protein [Deltaproteobacteria bacterium]